MMKFCSVLKMCLVGMVILGMRMSVGLAEGIPVVDISTGVNHTCMLLQDKTVQCWGYNNEGQLGNGTTIVSTTPVVVQNLINVKVLRTEKDHFCALLEDGTVKCWGENGAGQLGDGTTVDRLTPVTVLGLSNVKDIALVYGKTSCALLNDGTVNCWGGNFVGQLGDGTINNSSVPVLVSGLSNVESIASNGSALGHFCALLEDGTVKCWGYNSYGQLGDGTTKNQSIPISVSGLSNVKKITRGGAHTCALLEDATVKCWGENGAGQIGKGVFSTYELLPEKILASVKDILGGGSYTCALMNDETVKCWGSNSLKQLADGTTTNNSSPVTISEVQNAVQLSISGNHTCAGISNGDIKCWGYNAYGQIGDGTTTNRLVPTPMTLGFKFASTQTAPACTESDWTSAIAPEVCPSTEEQTKTWIKTGMCDGGVTYPETETLS